MKEHVVTLTETEIALLKEALDSHRYWQLSDEHYRNSGYVTDPGSDDEEKAEEIRDCDALEEKLANLTSTPEQRIAAFDAVAFPGKATL
jgi:hypothetical protein